MSTWNKIVVRLLLFLMVFPLQSITFPKKVTAASPAQKKEILEQRTEYSKTFSLPSGTREKVIYNDPIHYQQVTRGAATWQEIDNSLNKSLLPGTSTLKNRSNSFDLNINQNLVKDGTSLSIGKNLISFKLDQIQSSKTIIKTVGFNQGVVANIAPVVSENKVTYKKVANDTDIIYYSMTSGLKEDIVINKYNGQNQFVYNLAAPNTYWEKTSDGSYNFYDISSKKLTFVIPKMYMSDSRGGRGSIDNEYSYDIDTKIIGSNNLWKLMITASDKWLSEKSRVFPIVLDPTINVNLHYTEDTYVQEGYPNLQMWPNSDIYVGRGSTKKRTRALIPFSYDNLTNARIIRATVNVYQIGCFGVCNSTPVQVELTRDYDWKQVTWNTQPEMLGIVGETFNSTSSGWVGFDVTNAAKHWYNDGNPSGSKIGSFMFVHANEGDWGYRIWSSESNPNRDRQPSFVIEYNDYNVQYSISAIPDVQVLTTVTPTVVVQNTGRNYWSKSDTKLGYHLINNSTGQRWDNWFELPGDVCPGGCSTSVTPSMIIPDSPGDYSIRWDMIQPGVTWFSDQGLTTASDDFNVRDFPEYAAEYGGGIVSSVVAGTTMKISVEVTNRSRYDWNTSTFGVGYHWYKAITGELVIQDGKVTPVSAPIVRREGFGTILADVKAPVNSGNYVLKFDMYRMENSQWFSNNSVVPLAKNVTVLPPSYSSMTHLGTEDYYTKAGPVDLATGNIAFSTSDMKVNSNTGGLDITRSYNSTFMDNLYSSDSEGYIKTWLFNGPYQENDEKQRLIKPYINEETVKPSLGSVSNGNMWFSGAEDSSSIISLNKAFWAGYAYQLDAVKNASGYAFVYVYSPTDKAVKLKLASDDGIRVWLNGQSILSNDVYRSAVLDSDNVSTGLKKGWNTLLLKVSQGVGGWQMAARFTNTDDSLVSDLKYSNNNPDIFSGNRSFGYGWTANFDESLNNIDTESVYYRDSTGTVNIYTKKSDGTYQRPSGSTIDLLRNPDNTYSLLEKSGVRTYFRQDGKISYRTDLSGNKLKFEYDSAGRCIRIVDGNRFVSIAYNSGGNVSQIINPQSEKTTYIYVLNEGKQYLDTITNSLGNSSSYEYYNIGRPTSSKYYRPIAPNTDSSLAQNIGKMTATINKNGNRTTIYYSSEKKVSEIIDAAGGSSRFSYNNKTVTVLDPLSRRSIADFSENNTLISFTDPKGYKELYQTDGNYNIAAITPAIEKNSNYFFRWAYQYDTYSNPISEADPLDRKQSFEYKTNDLTKAVDGSLNTTEFNYSSDGRRLLSSIKDPNSNIKSYNYDSSGRVVASIDENGAKTMSSYSSDGDMVSMTSPKNEKTIYSYDKNGKLISSTSSLGTTNYFSYDSSGKVSTIKDPAGLTIKNSYDANGNITKTIDPKGASKIYVYDVLDRLVKITDEIGASISYVYDAVGNKIKTIDANNKPTLYKYNEIDQIVEVVDPSGGITKFEYNTINNISKITRPNGNVIDLAQNKAGDTTTIKKVDGTTSISYDSSGKAIGFNSGSEKNIISYDKNSNITSVSSALGESLTTYDKTNQPLTTSLRTNAINYSYDANGQVSQVSSKILQNGQTILNTFVRDTEGRIVTINKGNGDTSSFVYDKSSRVSTLTNRSKQKVLQSKYSYQYDLNSNITASYEERTKKLTSYSYDERNQLIKENGTTYAYDLMGNRTKMISGANSVSYYYDSVGDSNRLVKYGPEAGENAVSLEYDKNGNIIKQISSGGITQYFYDSDDYFVKAIMPDKSMVEYVYDKMFKHRVERIETSSTGERTTLKYIWDEDRLISETDSAGKIVRSYTWDENESLYSITLPNPAGVLQTYYYVKDGKGNILGMTDLNGSEVVKYEYDAWGNIIKSTTVSSSVQTNLDKLNPRLYSGYMYDSKLGFYVMRARMYNPVIGRFMSVDPMQVGTDALDFNPYIYCGNNPITRIDPSGKFIFLTPLIYCALASIATAATAGINLLLNNPALLSQAAEDAESMFNKSKSTVDRILAGIFVSVDVIPVGGGAKKTISESAKAAKEVSRQLSSGAKGKLGESIAQEAFNFVKNTKIIKSIGRIPDGVSYTDGVASVFYEVKNVGYQTYTSQLKDMIGYATKNNIQFKLIVRQGAKISNSLQALKDAGKITIDYLNMKF